MEVLKLKFSIAFMALKCRTCSNRPKPHHGGGPHLYLCGAGHLVCGSCMLHAHKMICGGSLSSDCCRLLEDIASRIEVKCACGGYFRYCKLNEHRNFCKGKFHNPGRLKCSLEMELVCCCICGATLRPPVFKGSFDDHLACADCYHASTNKDNFVHCPELDYLFKVMMVKTQRPFFSPCDEGETNSAVVGSNIIIGKANGKTTSKVGKTDKHIVECQEARMGDSCPLCKRELSDLIQVYKEVNSGTQSMRIAAAANRCGVCEVTLFEWLSSHPASTRSYITRSTTRPSSSPGSLPAASASCSKRLNWPKHLEDQVLEVLREYKWNNAGLPKNNELEGLFQSVLPQDYVDKEKIRRKIWNLKVSRDHLNRRKNGLDGEELERYAMMMSIWP